MSHITTIDFLNPTTPSTSPTPLKIGYQADTDGETVTFDVLVAGVQIDPPSTTVPKGSGDRTVDVRLKRGVFKGSTVVVRATIMIDPDHGSSAFDNIELVG
jgi:hypothetical protein